MTRLKTSVWAFGFVASAWAQSSEPVDELSAQVSAYVDTAGSDVAATSAVTGDVISLFLPGSDQQGLVGSMIGSDASLTTVAINCAPSVPTASCAYPNPATITQGASTVNGLIIVPDYATLSYSCQLFGTTSAICGQSVAGDVDYIGLGGDGASGTSSYITTESLNQADITFFPCTITAGMDGKKKTVTTTSGTPKSESTKTTSAKGESESVVKSVSDKKDESVAVSSSEAAVKPTADNAAPTTTAVPVAPSAKTSGLIGTYVAGGADKAAVIGTGLLGGLVGLAAWVL